MLRLTVIKRLIIPIRNRRCKLIYPFVHAKNMTSISSTDLQDECVDPALEDSHQWQKDKDETFDIMLGATYNLVLLASQPWGTDWLGKEYHLKVRELLRGMFRCPESGEHSKTMPVVLWKTDPAISDGNSRCILEYQEAQQIWNPMRRDSLLANLGLSDYAKQVNSEKNILICDEAEERFLGRLLEDTESFQSQSCQNLIEVQENSIGDVDTSGEQLDETFQILRKELIAKLPLPPPKHSRSYLCQKSPAVSREEVPPSSWNTPSPTELTSPQQATSTKNQQGDCSKNCRTRMRDRLNRWLSWLKKEDPCKTGKNISENESRELIVSNNDIGQVGTPLTQNKQNSSWPGINLRFGRRIPIFKDKKRSSNFKENSRNSLSGNSSCVEDSISIEHSICSDASTESDPSNTIKGKAFLCKRKETKSIWRQPTPFSASTPKESPNKSDTKAFPYNQDVYDVLGRNSPNSCNEEIDESMIQSIIEELSIPTIGSPDQRENTSDDEKFVTADDSRPSENE